MANALLDAHLRPARPEDVPALCALIASVYAEYGLTLNVEADEPHLVDPCAHFRRAGGDLWVYEESGAILASVAVLLREGEAELKTLYVHPSLRRRGVGAALTRHAMDFARAAGRPRVCLWSDTRFVDAHRLYTRLGFTQRGLRDLHDSNHSFEYGFELALGG